MRSSPATTGIRRWRGSRDEPARRTLAGVLRPDPRRARDAAGPRSAVRRRRRGRLRASTSPLRRRYRVDAALRLDTTDHAGRRPGEAGRQHDDGVGSRSVGCRSSTTNWSNWRRLPAGAENGPGRQGRAEGGPASVASGGGHRPGEGLLPRPRRSAICTASCSTWLRDALTNGAARSPRAVSRPSTVKTLLAAPNETRTTLGSNMLWQLAVLEMWLQSMEG